MLPSVDYYIVYTIIHATCPKIVIALVHVQITYEGVYTNHTVNSVYIITYTQNLNYVSQTNSCQKYIIHFRSKNKYYLNKE